MKFILLFLIINAGCASYRYEVISKDGDILHVKKDVDLILPAQPAEIRFRQVESRCVVRVANASTQPFEIDATGSAIVDPTGQSRALASQAVPPGAYAEYVIPPLREYAPRGPQFQIGLGMRVEASTMENFPDRMGERQMVYLSAGTKNMEFWEWRVEGQVRLLWNFKQNEIPHRHEILLRRIRQ